MWLLANGLNWPTPTYEIVILLLMSTFVCVCVLMKLLFSMDESQLEAASYLKGGDSQVTPLPIHGRYPQGPRWRRPGRKEPTPDPDDGGSICVPASTTTSLSIIWLCFILIERSSFSTHSAYIIIQHRLFQSFLPPSMLLLCICYVIVIVTVKYVWSQ